MAVIAAGNGNVRLTTMTFSIVARSADGTAWGVAVASKFLAVGSVVPAARAGVGAIATQASANVGYKAAALDRLAAGTPAAEVLHRLTAADDGRDHRQAGLVDRDGGAATYTGEGCLDWAGGTTGDGYAIQGNILTGPEVVEAMRSAWEATSADEALTRRLLAALAAGDAAGGDRRGRQSAALFVVRDGAGYGAGDDIACDLRVDDHAAPVDELDRLLDVHELLLTASTENDRVSVDDRLAGELEAFARARGHRDFAAWVGTENYEMRVADDLSWIDRRILAIVRRS